MKTFRALPALLLAAVLLTSLSACALPSKPVACPVCYEDEWSREPFPGQAKQYIPPLDPATVGR